MPRIARVRAPSIPPGTDAKVSLILADARPIELRLRDLFEAEPDLSVLACCGDDRETMEAVISRAPDVLVLDFELPRRGGMAVLDELVRRGVSTHVVLLASHITDDEVFEAVRIGAKGVVLREMTAPVLVQCIRHVSRGEMWLENRSFPAVVDRLVRSHNRMRTLREQLTPRELQILQLVGEGLRNRDINARLDITEGTVKIHIHNIYVKLGASNRLQLALLARDERFGFAQRSIAALAVLSGVQHLWNFGIFLWEAGVLV